MNGARTRLLAWLIVLAGFITGCTPTVGLDAAPREQPPSTASATTVVTEAAVAPQQAPAAETPPPVPTPASVPQPFALNLYQEGDFVPQYTFDWCVAASIQIAHNLIDDTGGGTWTDSAQQGDLWEMARARSSNSYNGANPL